MTSPMILQREKGEYIVLVSDKKHPRYASMQDFCREHNNRNYIKNIGGT